MISSISFVIWIVAAMLTGKRFIPIEQINEKNTVYIYELRFLIPMLNWQDKMLVSLVFAQTPAFRSESKTFQPIQLLQQDGPLNQRDQSSTA